MCDHYLSNVVGNPLESSIAIAHLIFDGVLDAYPSLNICVAHGGGYLPYYPGRMMHAFANRPDCRGCKASPETYLKKLYYDTVVYDPQQLAHLIDLYGTEHVLLGTDWPYDMAERDPMGLIAAVPSLGDDERRPICGENALRLPSVRQRVE